MLDILLASLDNYGSSSSVCASFNQLFYVRKDTFVSRLAIVLDEAMLLTRCFSRIYRFVFTLDRLILPLKLCLP